MAKDKKGLYIGIGVALIVAVIVGVVIALSNKGNGTDGEPTPNSALTAADFSPIDVTIDFGQYDEMFTLSKDVQNGYAVGKIVKIEGLVSHPGTKYSIVQEKESGSGSIGTEFVIEGDDVKYPSDGDRVVLVGKVVERSALYYNIQTIPELVNVVSE